jgi:hypothetical protein
MTELRFWATSWSRGAEMVHLEKETKDTYGQNRRNFSVRQITAKCAPIR